jgi:hypothetical protein
VVQNPDHGVGTGQSQRICAGCKVGADHGLVVVLSNHLVVLLDLGVLVEVLDGERCTPHSTSGGLGANLATDQLLGLRSNTICSNHHVGLVGLALLGLDTSLAPSCILEVINNVRVEVNLHTKLLDLANEHPVDERTHLESSGRSLWVETSGLQTLCDLKRLCMPMESYSSFISGQCLKKGVALRPMKYMSP